MLTKLKFILLKLIYYYYYQGDKTVKCLV